MRCSYCRAQFEIPGLPESGLHIEYKEGGLVIYYCSRPIHSCDLERAHRADRHDS